VRGGEALDIHRHCFAEFTALRLGSASFQRAGLEDVQLCFRYPVGQSDGFRPGAPASAGISIAGAPCFSSSAVASRMEL
jgi:hypothetical protein